MICKRSNPTWKIYMNFQSSKLKLHFSEKMKLISSILLLNAVNCMYFYLEPGTKKCIKECFTKSDLKSIGHLNVVFFFPFLCIRFCETCERKKFIRMSLLLENMKLPNRQTIRFSRIIFIPISSVIWYLYNHLQNYF